MPRNASRPDNAQAFWPQALDSLLDDLRAKNVVQAGRFSGGFPTEVLNYLKTHSGKLVLVDSYPAEKDEIAHEDASGALVVWPTNLDEAAALVPDFDMLIIAPEYPGDSRVLLCSALMRSNAPRAIILVGNSANLASEWDDLPHNARYEVCYSTSSLAVIVQSPSPLTPQTAASLAGLNTEMLVTLLAPRSFATPSRENKSDPSNDGHASFATRVKRGLARRARSALSKVKPRPSHGVQAKPADTRAAFLAAAAGQTGVSRTAILAANQKLVDARGRMREEKSAPQASVIVRASNSENVKHAVEMCFAQDDSAIGELIIVGPPDICAAASNSLEGSPAQFRIAFAECLEGAAPARMNNVGARAASCDYLLFLDSGCEPAPHWASELLCVAEQNPSAGAIGSRDVILAQRADDVELGVVRQMGVSFEVALEQDDAAVQPRFRFSGEHATRNIPDSPFPVCSVGDVCLLTTRSAFEAVGGFDEGYQREFESVDFCLKLFKAGCQNLICPSSLVFSRPISDDSDANELAVRHSNDLLLLQRRWQQFIADAMLSDIENGTALFVENEPPADMEALNGICVRKRNLNERKVLLITPCDSWDNAESWGDYHFAVALKKQFEKRGYEAVIRITPEWYEPFDGKYIIALQGLFHYVPSAMHASIMWNISHPDDFEICEYDRYDKVFVASRVWAEHLNPLAHSPVETMLQCTDPELFANDSEHPSIFELLFVGNTRGVFREAVQWLLPTTHRLDLFGKGWEEHVDPEYIKGEVIPNRWLNRAYSSCKILLNDHWADMRRLGFVSNRIFDGLAAGAFILTDSVAGFEDELSEYAVVYHNKEELRNAVEYYLTHEDERRSIARKGQQVVLEKHTFEKRVETFLSFIESRD